MTSPHGLTIGSNGFELPIDLATGSIAMLAIKGAGKSYTSAVLAEEIVENDVPVCVIDLVGVYWGLKSSANGKSAALPFTVFGGDHADLPLEEGSGEVLARAIVENRFHAIIDLSLFRKGEMLRFLTPFLETIYRLNRNPIHLICDEADAYAPQKSWPDVARCLGAMEDIVRRGRARGIGSTLITQRPASINKDVLTQCDCLFALRIGHPKDMAPINDWVEVHGDPDTAVRMMKALPGLKTGEAWVWCPRANIFEQIQIRRRRTFDSSATPKIGEEKIEPNVLAKADIEKLGKEIQATVERAKENDPNALKAKVRQLQKDLAAKPAVAPERIEVPMLTEMERKQIEGFHVRVCQAINDLSALVKGVESLVTSVRGRVKSVPAPMAAALHRTPKVQRSPYHETITTGSASPLSKAERSILTVLAQFGDSSKSKVAAVAGYSGAGGGFNNALSSLRVKGHIMGSDPLGITPTGQAALGDYVPLPTGSDLIAHWLGRLSKAESAILRTVTDAHPNALSKSDVAAVCGYEVAGGGFNNALSSLRTLELISRGDPIKASDNLF